MQWRVEYGPVAECLSKGRQVEEACVRARDRKEQQLVMERRVVDVLVGLGENKQRACGDVDRKPCDSPRNEAMDRCNRHAPGYTEEAQIERADTADQHAEAEEVQALGDWPTPRGSHE